MGMILIVEDDDALLATLKYNLEREGHHVVAVRDGESALAAARSQQLDLVILDLVLPGMHGLDVCRQLRQEGSVPIIMLSALADEVDRVVGLELGADDYVTKPFGTKEFVARVQALLRRADMPPTSPRDALVSGDLRIERGSRRAYVGGRQLALKPKEYELLAYLMEHRGRMLTRRQLLDHVWMQERSYQTRTLDVHIGQLRRSIGDDPRRPRRIVTVRNVGYRFDG
jgi:two-component system response regulator RegX3